MTMKELSLLVFLFGFCFVQSQNIDIPDVNFKNALVNTICVDTNGDGELDNDVDINNDGEIQVSEAESVIFELNIRNKNISSLQGIEYFMNLKKLDCYGNDISGWNIDLSSNLALEYLDCSYNSLITIDISQNINLVSFTAYQNGLTSLNVSYNSNLEYLNVHNNNLNEIDLSNNINLKYFQCQGNYLTSIDISENINLEYLACVLTYITELDISNNINLKSLSCSNNSINNLDLSNNAFLEVLDCSSNQLNSLDITHNLNLEYLACSGNELTSIDVSMNEALTDLLCSHNQLTELDISNNPFLLSLQCWDNQITSLDFAYNPNIVWFDCSDNLLESLIFKNGVVVEGYEYYYPAFIGNPTLEYMCVDEAELTQLQDIVYGIYGYSNVVFDTTCNTISTNESPLKNKIVIYPNPTNDYLTIESSQDFSKVLLTNNLGQNVHLNLVGNRIDFINIPKGLYYLIIFDNTGKRLVKSIIKK